MIIGTASSSLQCEGAAPRSDWAGWEAAGWAPPSGDGNGFADRYAEDFALLAQHGITAHRLTLEWARLEPHPTGRLDTDEVERYRRMLRAAGDAGVSVWACLVHTTLPGWFSEDERGFLDEGMARRVWPAHVDRVAEAFGDLVEGWITFDEPVRYALEGWLHGVRPPGRRDGPDTYRGLRELQRADAEAARLLASGAPAVASCQWLPTVVPFEPTPESRQAAVAAEDLIWRSWQDDDAHELLGVSCSDAIAVATDGSFHPWPLDLAEAVHHVADEHPGRELLVFTGVVDDEEERRSQRTVEREAAVHAIAADGLPVRACLWWSAIDGYEGRLGFDSRSGLFDRDRNPVHAPRGQRPR